MSQAPILKTPWSDAEKLALLLSIIKSSGHAPKWSSSASIAVPQGRTMQASQKMYGEIVKAGASVKMTTGDAVTPSGTKRSRGSGPDGGDEISGDGNSPQKRKKKQRRGRGGMLSSGTDGGGDVVHDDDEEDFLAKEEEKKVKKEKKEGAVKVEGEGAGFDADEEAF